MNILKLLVYVGLLEVVSCTCLAGGLQTGPCSPPLPIIAAYSVYVRIGKEQFYLAFLYSL